MDWKFTRKIMSDLKQSLMYKTLEEKLLLVTELPNRFPGFGIKPMDFYEEGIKKGKTWRPDYQNVFTVTVKGLSGVIGNFREGGEIPTTSLEDLSKGIINGGDSIFDYVNNRNNVEPLKANILEYAKELYEEQLCYQQNKQS